MEPRKFMKRERTSLWVMAYGVYVYYSALSLRKASRILEPVQKRSHEAIRQWAHRFSFLASRFRVRRGSVHSILIDETMIHIGGREAWVWIAFDPLHRQFLGFRISYQRNILDAYYFIRHLRSRYGRKPIWTDEGAWYPEACRWLGMEHHVYPIGWKNFMERLNQTFKDRVECFDDYFPCWKEECDRGHVCAWIRTFSFYYNFVREHSELGFPPALYDSPLKEKPEADRFISLVQEAIQ
jgi:putative transposase